MDLRIVQVLLLLADKICKRLKESRGNLMIKKMLLLWAFTLSLNPNLAFASGQGIIKVNNLLGIAIDPTAPTDGQCYNYSAGSNTWVPGSCGTGGGGGSVTSVALSLPAIFSVSGSPVTTSGTLSATLASQLQNRMFASPSGSSGAPTFRAIVAADLPLSSNVTTGALSSTDWNTFNGKQAALSFGDLTDVGTDGISVGSGVGAVIGSGTSISQHVSDTSHAGYLSAADWNTFSGKQDALSFSAPLVNSTGTISIPVATGSVDGYLSSSSQTIGGVKNFSANIFAANLSGTNSGDVTIGTASGLSLTGSSQILNLALSTSSNAGALSAADWTTFNAKQDAGNYITALTGDVSASGPGSATATVNSIGGVTSTDVANTVTGVASASAVDLVGNTIVKRASGTFAAGSIGVGTASPAALFSVGSTSAFKVDNSGSVTGSQIAMASTGIRSVNHAASPYTIISTDALLLVDTSGGSVTINLPNPSGLRKIKIKDATGNFGTVHPTIARFGSEKIENTAADLILWANFGNYELQSNGTDWFKTSAASNTASAVFTSSGTLTFPVGISNTLVCGLGGTGGGGPGGGGGGGSTTTAARGGGSGSPAGATATRCMPLAISGNVSYTITIGAKGVGQTGGAGAVANAAGATGSTGSNGTNGGASLFDSLATFTGSLGGHAGGGAGLATNGAAGTIVDNNEIINRAGIAGGVAATAGADGQDGLSSFFGTGGAHGTGGTSGASTGGGGGGGTGPAGGDTSVTGTMCSGGAGGLAGVGSPGSDGPSESGNFGVGGAPGCGGGGGGILAVSGTAGGKGGNSSDGNPGKITARWQE